MLINGFIRDEDGDWFSTVGLDRIVVECSGADAMNRDFEWHIEGIWIVDGEDCKVTIQSGFDDIEEAQNALDKMMGMK